MKVLVACEFSGVVREAFRRKGHDAWSCDIEPAMDGSLRHYKCDVLGILHLHWDLMIAHPPCTYLASSGLHWNKRVPGRSALTDEALLFVQQLWNAPIPRICIENPIGCINTRGNLGVKPQIIHPYQFGDDASKATCLFLKNLPKLVPSSNPVPPRITATGKKRWANQTNSGQNILGPSEDRAKIRSLTYQGIADAMAEQWG